MSNIDIKIIIQRLEAINSDDLLKKVVIRDVLLRKGITVMVYLKKL
jgi:hypothetical protein